MPIPPNSCKTIMCLVGTDLTVSVMLGAVAKTVASSQGCTENVANDIGYTVGAVSLVVVPFAIYGLGKCCYSLFCAPSQSSASAPVLVKDLEAQQVAFTKTLEPS